MVVVGLALAGCLALAQSDGKAGQVTVTGTVTRFEVAKSIEVDSGGVSHKYDLNESDTVYSISPEVAAGRTVTVTQTADGEGHRTVTIALSAAKT